MVTLFTQRKERKKYILSGILAPMRGFSKDIYPYCQKLKNNHGSIVVMYFMICNFLLNSYFGPGHPLLFRKNRLPFKYHTSMKCRGNVFSILGQAHNIMVAKTIICSYTVPSLVPMGNGWKQNEEEE